MSESSLHITIGASSAQVASIEKEIRLVKAGLLYGDKVLFCSVMHGLLHSLDTLDELTEKEMFLRLDRYAARAFNDRRTVTQWRNNLAKYQYLKRKENRTPTESRDFYRLNQIVEQLKLDATSQGKATAQKGGLNEIKAAQDSGMLEIHEFKSVDTEKMVVEFGEVVGRIIGDHNTYPLFDDQTGSLARAGLEEGLFKASDVRVARGKHVALANNLFGRLPLFESASVTEVLDIRSELSKPLDRFRSAMFLFSESIRSASWDEDFPIEADQVFHKEVTPAIDDIELA